MSRPYTILRISRQASATTIGELSLPPSKSIMARQLILDYLLNHLPTFGQDYLATLPDDCRALYLALRSLERGEELISVEESGTAMRGRTALLAAVVTVPTELRGTGRQHQRPITPLVESLRQLGADIEYLEQVGYPPLQIRPSVLTSRVIQIDASMSSQYLSALMLIVPCLTGEAIYGLDYSRYGLSSSPYAEMTYQILRRYGIEGEQIEGLISFSKRTLSLPSSSSEEKDWSASSYAYELVALYPDLNGLRLEGLRLPSLQGDARYIKQYFGELGVRTHQTESGVYLYRNASCVEDALWSISCQNCPDLVPALVATALGLGQMFAISGVAHLRIKESDRLTALQQEVATLGFVLEVGEDYIAWRGQRCPSVAIPSISSHHDHRIAMAIAPLACYVAPHGTDIEEPEVVHKSFPRYWTELERLGFVLEYNK